MMVFADQTVELRASVSEIDSAPTWIIASAPSGSASSTALDWANIGAGPNGIMPGIIPGPIIPGLRSKVPMPVWASDGIPIAPIWAFELVFDEP